MKSHELAEHHEKAAHHHEHAAKHHRALESFKEASPEIAAWFGPCMVVCRPYRVATVVS